MAGNRFVRKSFALISAIWLTHTGFAVNPLTFESINPDVFNLPNYNNCFDTLNGVDGYFYAHVCLNDFPWDAVYRSQDGVSWAQIGPGARGTKGLKLTNGKVLLYGHQAEVTLGQDDSWEVKDVAPLGSAINGAVEGVGRVVIVGSARPSRSNVPSWLISTDGGDSFTAYNDTDYGNEQLEAVTYGNGKYVAVGAIGEAWLSEDAVTWTKHSIPQASGRDVVLRDVKYHAGAYFACGDHDTIFRSSDGMTWELLTEGTPFARLNKLVIEGDNVYAGGTGRGVVASFDGGQNWSSYTNSFYTTQDLTGGNGYYYAGRHLVAEGGLINPERQVETGWWDPFAVQHVAYTQGKWLVLTNQDSYFGQSNLGETDFWANATPISDDLNEHAWFGTFGGQSGSWAYHFNMGWTNAYAVSNSAAWLFTEELEWIYTSEALWPFFYHFNSGHFAHYDGDPDWFWNVYLEADMQREEFYDMPWVVRKDWFAITVISVTDSLGTHLISFPPEISTGTPLLFSTFNFPHPDNPDSSFFWGSLFNLTLDNLLTDTSRDAGLVPGRQFTLYTNPQYNENPPTPNDLTVILTFTDENGGTSSISHDFGPGYQATDVEGTFTVQVID